MPRVKAIGLYTDRKEYLRKIITIGMIRNGITGKELEQRNIMNQNTLYLRKREGGTIRLKELWDLDKALKFTDEEILQMFGRTKRE